jgi:crotonobetainyl-CoA:carnitine CoA-transferase CaiB-like acyl-CoA transferase
MLPLSGIRILDLTRVLAGPHCTATLGDLGADVLKIERPGTGDDSRGWGPPFDERGESAYYLSTNRNKLSCTADLADATDRALIEQLIAGADAVVDNFLPGTLERRGLDPRRLLDANPALVWCTITGFGLDSARAGYDFVVQAESGWMSINGEPTGAPMRAGVAFVDVITGKDAAIQLLAALVGTRARIAAGEEVTPRDRRVSVSLNHSAIGALVNVAQNSLVTGQEAARWGNAHANLVPYQLFDAADRPVVIAVGNDAQFAALVRALELPSLAGPRFVTNAARLAERDMVVDTIAARVATQPAAQWIARLDAEGVPCGVVRTVREALADVPASPRSGVAPQGPGTVRRDPPRLGEHDAIVRAEGWDAFRHA